ncbi:MAG TPA: LamG-like jellyroll fold domain-containing protein, partial [Candidatus Acidoferrum sp.]|nr:LamG-like jellyroll fold domain-containing protein [Candidatus Acidoferrum sp.]
MTWLVFQAIPGHAAVTTVSHWRMGENDTVSPFFGGVLVFTNLTDETGNFPLSTWGTVVYSTNVSAAAFSATESTASAEFLGNAFATNSIVSTATNNFGIECWVNSANPTNEQIIAYNGHGSFSGWGLMIHQTNYCGLFGGVAFIGAVPAVPNVWTHLALVRANGTTTLYVNGVPAATTTAAPNIPTTLFALGAAPQVSSGYFNGYLDEVRVFTFVTNQFSTSDLLLNWKVYVDTTDRLEGPGAAGDTLFLGTPSSFIAWTNTSNANWLHLAAPQQSGTNSGYIPFSFDANPGVTRTGTLTIAGQTVNVTQAGVTYTPTTQIGVLFNSFVPAGLAVDRAGTVYSTSGNAVFKWSPGDSIPSPFITTGLSGPQGLAFDYQNNLLIANGGISAISKWIAASNTLITLGSTPPAPTYLSLDFAGNVYFNTGGNNNNPGPLKWSPFSGIVTRVTSSPTNNTATYWGIGADAVGDVYYGFVGPVISGIFGQMANGTSFSGDTLSTRHPRGVAVDGLTTIYEGEATENQLKVLHPPSTTAFTVLSGVAPLQIAVDLKRNLYYSDSAVNGVKERPYALVDASGRTAPADAGTDTLSAVLPATANLMGAFAPTTDQPWLSIMGITNGVIYYSFTANTNVARTGHILVLGKSISVQQQGPSFALGTTNLLLGPGVGMASVVLFATPQTSTWTVSADVPWLQVIQTNGAGSTNLIFTYNQNMGSTRAGTITVAGQTITVTQAGVNYVPASAGVPLTASLSNSPCVAVDGTGNVYFTDTNGYIDYWSPTNQTTTVLVSNLVDTPASLAIDSTNNLYFSDPSNHSILEWSAGMVSTVLSNATMIPQGLAIDTADGIYLFDASDNAVKKWSAANNELYVIVTNVSGTTGIAVDAARNLYLANGPGNAVTKWNSVSGALLPLFSGLSNPQGVAVDGSGNVYVADTQANAIRKWSAADGTIN